MMLMILLILWVRRTAREAVGWKRRTTQDATPQAQGRSRKNNAMLMPHHEAREREEGKLYSNHSLSFNPSRASLHYTIHMCGIMLLWVIVVKANVAQITPLHNTFRGDGVSKNLGILAIWLTLIQHSNDTFPPKTLGTPAFTAYFDMRNPHYFANEQFRARTGSFDPIIIRLLQSLSFVLYARLVVTKHPKNYKKPGEQ